MVHSRFKDISMAGSAGRGRKGRDKMKAADPKQMTIRVPDVNAPGYAEQLAREIEIINADADSQRVMEEMLALADFSDWK
jgi:Protein  of unknown function (DUF3018)